MEEFITTNATPPTHDGMGTPFVHMACDGACDAYGNGGCAWFDGTRRQSSHDAGRTTNNKQEYLGLINLMKTLKNNGFTDRALILMDSQLVVFQMNGKYRVKDAGLLPYYQEAKSLESQLDVTIMWVPRTYPLMAEIDKMAKEARK